MRSTFTCDICENKGHSYPIFLERSLRDDSIVPLYNLFPLPESDSLYSQSSNYSPLPIFPFNNTF